MKDCCKTGDEVPDSKWRKWLHWLILSIVTALALLVLINQFK